MISSWRFLLKKLFDQPDSNESVGRTASYFQLKTGHSLTVTYTGFTQEAQDAFQAAVDIWARLISSPIPIRIDANFDPLGFDPEGENVLGQAGPTIVALLTGGGESTWFPISLARSLLEQNLFPEFMDIVATFNSDFPDFYFGTDRNAPAGQIDFLGIVLHELGHGFGFSDSFQFESGTGEFGFDATLPIPACPCPIIFDRFVSTADEFGSSQFLVDNVFANPSADLGGALTSNHLYFNGASTLQAFHGNRPALHAPTDFGAGSSIAHLDEFGFPSGSPEALMSPWVFSGERVVDPGPVTLAIFRDMGWTVIETGQLAHFGDGGGLGSDVVVSNLSSTRTATGSLDFFDPNGDPLDASDFLEDPLGEGTDFELQPLGTKTFSTTGTSSPVVSGSATVTSDSPVSAVIRFTISGLVSPAWERLT